MNEFEKQQAGAVKKVKDKAKLARKTLANPDFAWLLQSLKVGADIADKKIHLILSNEGGDLLELKRLQAKIDVCNGLANEPNDWLQAEKNMKAELKRQKKEAQQEE